MNKRYTHSSFDDDSYPKQASVHVMLRELKYHYENYKSNRNSQSKEFMKFEILAYLSVLGRVYYFLRTNNLLLLTPSVEKFIILRHKVTAHRSVDVKKIDRNTRQPELVDMPENANLIDSAYSGFMTSIDTGDLILPKIVLSVDESGEQLSLPSFSIENEHHKITQEITRALEKYDADNGF